MSRVKFFLYGITTGGAGYLGLTTYTQDKLRNAENAVISMHNELAATSPSMNGKQIPLRMSVWDDFRKDISTSFRRNWNSAVEQTYNTVADVLKNPVADLLKPSTSAPLPTSDISSVAPTSPTGDSTEAEESE